MPFVTKTPAELEAIVARFNSRWKVGDQVILHKDTGDVVTRVKYPAEVMGGHSAVAWFENVSGAYSIEGDRVSALPSE